MIAFKPRRKERISREQSIESDTSAKAGASSSDKDRERDKERDKDGKRRSLTRESSKESEGKVRYDDPKSLLIARQKNPIIRSSSEGTYPPPLSLLFSSLCKFTQDK